MQKKNDPITVRRYSEARLPLISRAAFAHWGADQVAYVRPTGFDGTKGFAIHAADGRTVGFAETFDRAAASILQHNLFPLSVH